MKETPRQRLRSPRPKALEAIRAAAPGTLGALTVLISAQGLMQFAYTPTQQLAVLQLIRLDPASAGSAAGLGYAVAGVGATLAAILYARFARRMGFLKLAITAAILLAAAITGLAIAGSTSLLVVGMAVSGLLYGALLPCTGSMLGLEAPPAVQSTVFGVNASALAIGSAAGPFLTGAVAAVWDVKTALLVAAFGAVLLALALGLRGARACRSLKRAGNVSGNVSGVIRVTIRDVAREAGVSVTTVSRALNGRADLAAAQRRHVLATVSRLQYVPSSAARTLVSGRSRTLGVVINDNTSPVYAQVLAGIEETAGAQGFGLVFTNSANSQDQALRCIDNLIGNQVDGLLLTPVQTDDRDLQRLRAAGIPFVLLLRHFDDGKTDFVAADNLTAGRIATQHLVDSGRRRIACIGGPEHTSTSGLRGQGYREAMEAAGIEPDPALIVSGGYSVEGGRAATHRLFGHRSPPEAIFAATDLQAVGVLKAARELGISVPDRLAVVGGDDIELGEFLEPPLTTFNQRGREIGAIGTQLLLDRLAGDSSPVRQFRLEPQLVVRRSCGCQ